MSAVRPKSILLAVVLFLVVGNCSAESRQSRGAFDALISSFSSLGAFFDKSYEKLETASKLEVLLDELENIGSRLDMWVSSVAPIPKNILDDIGGFVKDRIKLIFPGTLWCGDGDVANNYKNLGLFQQADSCCRAHDSCFDYIPAKSGKYNLNNTGLFTRVHCLCDREFYSCLKSQGDIISDNIGTTYFNILSPKCFEEEFAITKCKRNTREKCGKSSKANDYRWSSNLFY